MGNGGGEQEERRQKGNVSFQSLELWKDPQDKPQFLALYFFERERTKFTMSQISSGFNRPSSPIILPLPLLMME